MMRVFAAVLAALALSCATKASPPAVYSMKVYVCSKEEVDADTCPVPIEGKACRWEEHSGQMILACEGLCELREERR
jgi:hypothetical protein